VKGGAEGEDTGRDEGGVRKKESSERSAEPWSEQQAIKKPNLSEKIKNRTGVVKKGD